MVSAEQSGLGAGRVRVDFVPHDRYISQEFVTFERERLWTKVWLWACREEEIPHVGDFYTFDIAIALKGLRTNPKQERQVSHFHQILDGYLSDPAWEGLRRAG